MDVDQLLAGNNGDDQAILNPAVTELFNVWKTEANCPELLPFRGDLVNDLKHKLFAQQVMNKSSNEYNTQFIHHRTQLMR